MNQHVNYVLHCYICGVVYSIALFYSNEYYEGLRNIHITIHISNAIGKTKGKRHRILESTC